MHLAAKSGNTECVEFLQNEAEAVWGNFYCPNRYNLDKIQKEILFSSALLRNSLN
ncbi:hypothetical protein [Wolbachia endosymbiont of Ctenocephalides felis wCfeT]|uniref:hypothetical protein n=1 Tax=Wolbachia endosymbiont of Ctenocephalides felis wCfeT TaxID=2732593 RepID=UPI00350EC25C